MHKIINGNVVKLEIYKDKKISNYHLLPMEKLVADGWKPLVEDTPTYDETVQMLIIDNYEETEDTIIAHYVAVDIPESIPPLQEQFDGLVTALVDKGVVY